MEDIEAHYAPDWVLISELVTEEGPKLLAGKVLFHSPNRAEVYRKVQELMPGRFAVRYLGTYPEHMVLNL